MTGLERNADVVYMATYAPLFAHVEGWQWRPDLIWYDNLRSVRTCSYYVQQLYSTYKGTNVLTLTENGKPVAGSEGQDGLFASAVLDKEKNQVIVKVVNTASEPRRFDLTFNGLKKKQTLVDGEHIIFHSDNPDLENTVQNPAAVLPRTFQQRIEGNVMHGRIAPNTFCVYAFTIQ